MGFIFRPVGDVLKKAFSRFRQWWAEVNQEAPLTNLFPAAVFYALATIVALIPHFASRAYWIFQGATANEILLLLTIDHFTPERLMNLQIS